MRFSSLGHEALPNFLGTSFKRCFSFSARVKTISLEILLIRPGLFLSREIIHGVDSSGREICVGKRGKQSVGRGGFRGVRSTQLWSGEVVPR